MSGLTGNNILAGSSGQGGYEIEQSLRVEDGDSAYLEKTFSGVGTGNGSRWTFSCFVKRGNIGTEQVLIGAGVSSTGRAIVYFNSSDNLVLQIIDSGITRSHLVTSQVFRDVGSWYHIVAVQAEPDATSTDRVRLYVNGSRLTDFTTETYSSGGAGSYIPNAWTHRIGSLPYSVSSLFDGYLAEIHLIDGQSLDPSNFGETNPLTNQWIPKKYVGTYGTNGFYLPFSNGTSWSNYFDFSGDYIRVPSNSGAPFDFGTGNFTVEGWFYLTTSGSWTSYWGISQGGGASQKINLYDSTGNGTLNVDINGSVVFSSSAVLTDLQNKWAHIALVREGTGTNQTKLYVNGSVVGQGTVSANFSGFTQPFTVGHNGELYSGAFKGYISNFRVVKGTAVYTGSFTPPTSDLTAISGTQLLTCQNSTFVDNSANNLTVTVSGDTRTEKFSPISLDFTDDHSGNANNFTPTNLIYTDVVLDSPTNNFATLNPLDPAANQTLSEGNLKQVTSGQGISKGTMQIPSSGKWYWEVCQTDTDQLVIGIAKPTATLSNYLGSDANGWGYGGYDGSLYNNGSGSSYGNTYTNGDIVGVAFDADNQAVYFSKNNTWQNSGDPTSGSSKTGAAVSSLTDEYSPASGSQNSSGVYNFGQDSSFAGNKTAQGNGGVGEDFYYAPPTGYKALNTSNLDDPSIALPTDHFNTALYTGNGSTQSITGVGFQPDFTWLKNRGSVYQHQAYDAVRGATKKLLPSDTNAEATDATALSSFDSDGFSLGSNVGVNQNTINHVAWNWKAGGTASSNTDGTITSSVSANTTAGFSIVSYTGTGSAATIGHGLSQIPEFIIVRNRDDVEQWVVYAEPIGNTKHLRLNTNNAEITETAIWNNTTPTSSVFTVGTSGAPNGSSDSHIAYCFHSVEGYSKVGSYTGNGSTDGTFVYTGFRPAFLLIKRINATGVWPMFDNKRVGYNWDNRQLRANEATAEETYNAFIDILSNGFKCKNSAADKNASGGTYTYLAFAESPFKYSNAR